MFITKPATKRSIAFRKSILGVGINDATYQTSPRIEGKIIVCPFFAVWRSMLSRCYSDRYQQRQPTYKGCSVHREWHSFIAFRSWMEQQEWEGQYLDKDILVPGNKIYSPDTCLFVSKRVNNLLNDHRAKRGEHPIGVCKLGNKYMAQCSGRKNRYIGIYDTAEEAHAAWAFAKAEVVREVAETQPNNIRDPLLNFANML